MLPFLSLVLLEQPRGSFPWLQSQPVSVWWGGGLAFLLRWSSPLQHQCKVLHSKCQNPGHPIISEAIWKQEFTIYRSYWWTLIWCRNLSAVYNGGGIKILCSLHMVWNKKGLYTNVLTIVLFGRLCNRDYCFFDEKKLTDECAWRRRTQFLTT